MKFKILGFLLSAAFNLLGSSERPNIVFFIADDVSQDDFGCYGHPVIKTPHIDSLSANGMRFDNAYLTTSSCSPSRCSIITGRYPHNTGAPELHVRLPQQQVRFPELLREAVITPFFPVRIICLEIKTVPSTESPAGEDPGRKRIGSVM